MADNLHQFIGEKRKWSEPLSDADAKKGFKGWYASKHLPHFDSPGKQQFITYFDHYIRDEQHFWRVVRYLENNPTKAKLVRAPEDWEWSSARYRSRQDPSFSTLTHPSASRQLPPAT